jgi:hypothetical protein
MKIESSFIFDTPSWLLMLGLLALMLMCVYGGVKVHGRRPSATKEKKEARGAIMSPMLALFGFLLAFTFGMSGSRFDDRRRTIIDEANAIGTAILRADMYPDTARKAFRSDFKDYLEARITYYESRRHLADVTQSLNEADVLGQHIWDRASTLSRNRELFVASAQMIPAINNMLDLRTTRTVGELSRVPDSVMYMLFIIALVSAFFLGYTLADTIDWMPATSFCVLTVVIIFIIMDLDRPRRGFIDLSTSQQAMVELRKMF